MYATSSGTVLKGKGKGDAPVRVPVKVQGPVSPTRGRRMGVMLHSYKRVPTTAKRLSTGA